MKKLVAIIFIALLAGCANAPEEKGIQTNVVEDVTVLAPVVNVSGYVNTTNFSLEVVFDEPVLITEFTIDGVTRNISKSGKNAFVTAGVFSDGNHTVRVSAEDAAGNAVAHESWFFVDTVTPTVAVDPEDREVLNSKHVSIILSFSEKVTIIESKLDSGTVEFESDDEKEFVFSKLLDEGTHNLKLSAKDRAGNMVLSETSFTVSVVEPDQTPPPQITGVNATDNGGGGEIYLSWDATTVSDFREYRIYRSSSDIDSIDGMVALVVLPSKTTTHWIISGLTDGENYCFAVTAVDNAGNELSTVVDDCATPSTQDKTPPFISGESPTGTITDTNKPEIIVETNEKAYCKYSISKDSGESWTYSNLTYSLSPDSNKTLHTRVHSSALANGTWYVYVLCKDENDNVMSSVYDWNFVIEYSPPPDTTVPSITVIAPDNITYTTNSVWFNTSTNENVSSCAYSLDNGANNSMSNTSQTDWHENVLLDDGSHSVKFFCSDMNNNIGESETVYFSVDTTPPERVTSISKQDQTSVSITVAWSYVEPDDFDEYWVYMETEPTGGNATALTKKASTENTFYNFTGLNNSVMYYFLVVPVDKHGLKYLTGLTEKSWMIDK